MFVIIEVLKLFIQIYFNKKLGGSILWPGVQQVLEQRRRPIQLTILITNEGIRLIQMTQLRKREFVQSDHVSQGLWINGIDMGISWSKWV